MGLGSIDCWLETWNVELHQQQKCCYFKKRLLRNKFNKDIKYINILSHTIWTPAGISTLTTTWCSLLDFIRLIVLEAEPWLYQPLQVCWQMLSYEDCIYHNWTTQFTMNYTINTSRTTNVTSKLTIINGIVNCMLHPTSSTARNMI